MGSVDDRTQDDKGKKRGTFSKIIEHAGLFAVSTSAHGMVRLTFGSRLQRILWIFFIAIVFIGFCSHLTYSISNFLEYPVNVKTTTSSFNIEFPELTICAESFNIPSSHNVSAFYPYTNKTLSGVLRGVNRIWKEILVSRFHEMIPQLTRMAIKQYVIDSTLFLQPHEVVAQCLYRGEQCDFRNFTQYYHPEFGPCIKFVPDEDKRRLKGAGPNGGLFIILYTPDRYLWLNNWELLTYTTGYQMTIGPRGSRPNFKADVFLAQLDRWTIVEIDQQHRKSINRPWVTNCEANYGEVDYVTRIGRTSTMNTTFAVDNTECEIMEYQKSLSQTCQCVSPLFPVQASLSHYQDCTELPMEFLFHEKMWTENETGLLMISYQDKQYDFWYELTRLRKIKRLKCFLATNNFLPKKHENCPPACGMVYYQTEATVPPWPYGKGYERESMIPYIVQNYRLAEAMNLRTEVLKSQIYDVKKPYQSPFLPFHPVEIYARELKVAVHEEIYTFERPQLLSNIGGMMGLWIGYSVITLFEMFEFFMWIVHIIFTVRSSEKQNS